MCDTPFIRLMHFIMELRNGNEVSKLKVLHENGNRSIMAEQMILGMWPTISHLLLLKQHSTCMIRVLRIPHISTKRKTLTKAGSPDIPVLVPRSGYV